MTKLFRSGSETGERSTLGLIGAAVFAVVLATWRLGWLQSLELDLYDWFLRTCPRPPAANCPITLIGMTEADVRTLGYPLSDQQLADLLIAVEAAQPRVIGLDLYRDLAEPRSGEGRVPLEEALRKFTNVIAIEQLPDSVSAAVPPPPVLRDTERVGFNNFPVDVAAGGKIRRGLLFAGQWDGTQAVTKTSFGLQVARCYLEAEGIWAESGEAGQLRLGLQEYVPFGANDGGYVGADAAGYQCLLDFQAPARFEVFSVSRVLSGEVHPFQDKVVLIGLMAGSVRDEQPSPLGQRVHGVEWHAQWIDQLIRRARTADPPLQFLAEGWEVLLLALACGAGAAWVGRVRSAPIGVAGVVGALALLVTANQWALREDWWVPVVPASLALPGAAALAGGWRWQRERRERQFLMQLFSKHLSPEIAAHLWRERHSFLEGRRLRPQALMATILFSDLRDFTSAVQRTDPSTLMLWLNEYMEAMSAEIQARGGVIHEFVGDAILATFGVPVPRTSEAEVTQDAQAAVDAAVGMSRALVRLNEGWAARGLPMGPTRVGVATGLVVAGSLGSKDRLKYAVVGEVVVTAARLEGFEQAAEVGGTKDCRILVDEATWQRLGARFEGGLLGAFVLKGQDKPATIYHVLDRSKAKECP